MFGEPRVKGLEDNKVLETACNRLLLMISHNPSLLETISMAALDRRLYAEMLLEDGAASIVTDREAFIKTVIKCQDSEIVSRARRYLLEKDYIRLPQKVVVAAEQNRARISRGMK
jgi:hypothetical protein